MSVYSYPDSAFLPEVTRPLERVTERLSAKAAGVDVVPAETSPGDDVLDLSYYVDRSFGNRIVGGWSARRRNGSGGTGGAGGTGAGVALGAVLRPSGTASPVVRERGVLRIGAGANFSGIATQDFGPPEVQIPGRLWLGADVALDDWSPATNGFILGQWQPLFNQKSYGLQVNTNGTLTALMSADGASDTAVLTSSANLAGRANGERLLVGVDLQPNAGGGLKSATFYTAPPPTPAPAPATLEYLTGVTWSQLGVVVTGAGAISLFAANGRFQFGSLSSLAGAPILGKLFACELRNGGGPPPLGTRVAGVTTTNESPGRNLSGTLPGFGGRSWVVLQDGASFVAAP